jgi:ParB/RepB/Spo0J family partition protein
MAKAPRREVVDLDVRLVDEDPNQPRRRFGDLAELAASIKSKGVLQPILVRREGKRFMVVAGARRLRGAKLAGLEEIPGIVEDLTPEQALEIQLVENAQREDIHPMEEAEAYERLHAPKPEGFGYAVQEIAERVGKSASSVYASLKLCDLVPEARKAFVRGDLDASKAVLLARVKTEKGETMQIRALERITQRDKRGDLPSVREVAEILQRMFPREKRAEKESQRKTRAAADAEEQEIRRRAARAAIGLAVQSVERKTEFEASELRTMALALLPHSGEAVATRRGLPDAEHLEAQVKKLGAVQLRGLVFELAITPWLGDSAEEHSPALKALTKGFGIQIRALEEAARAGMEMAAREEEAEALFTKANRRDATH